MDTSGLDDLDFEMNTARSNTDVEAIDASTSAAGPDAPLLIHHADVEQAGRAKQGEDTPRKAATRALLVSQLPLDLLRDRAESSYVAIGCLLSISAAAATGAIMQLFSEVFEGAGKQNAIFSGLCHAILAVSLVFFKSIYGPLCDVWGRKPFLLMYIVGQALGMLGLTLSPSITTMSLGLILASLTPCQFVLYIIIVDITQHSHISIANKFGSYFALFGALALFAFPVGVLTPMWVGFLVALLAQLVALMLVLYIFPETLPLSEAKEEAGRANPKDAGTFSDTPAAAEAEVEGGGGCLSCTASSTKYNPVSLMRILSSTKATRRLSIAWFFRGMVIAGAESIYLAYTDSVFHWGPTEQGYALMFLGIGSAISNATISLQLWALGSGGVLLLGALSTLLFTLGGACLVAGWMVYVSIGLLLPFGFSWSTAAAGVIASELPKSQQGHLQGAVDSMLNIAQATGAVVVVLAFNFFVGDDGEEGAKIYFPQGAYLVLSLFALGGLIYTCTAIWYAGSDKLAMREVQALLSMEPENTAALDKAPPALLPAPAPSYGAESAPAAATDSDPLVVVEEAMDSARSDDDEAKRLAARLRRGSSSPPLPR